MIAEKILSALESVLKKKSGFIPLHEPQFTDKDLSYVQECLKSTFVSSVGKFVNVFEEGIAEYTGSKHAVAVVNGTSALQIALRVAGVSHNDEVLVPSMSFIATANAVSYCGAIPHFIDSNENTLGICVESLREWLKKIAEPANGVFRNHESGRRIRYWYQCTHLVTLVIWRN